MGPGCVKTCTNRECAELFSLFSSYDGDRQSGSFLIERNRDKLSPRKFDVGVFTQAGSKPEVASLEPHVRSTLKSRHRQDHPGTSVSCHERKSHFYLSPRGDAGWDVIRAAQLSAIPPRIAPGLQHVDKGQERV